MDINQGIPWDCPIVKYLLAGFHPQVQTNEGLRMRLVVAVCLIPAKRLRCFICCNIYRIGECVSHDDDDDDDDDDHDHDRDHDHDPSFHSYDKNNHGHYCIAIIEYYQ